MCLSYYYANFISKTWTVPRTSAHAAYILLLYIYYTADDGLCFQGVLARTLSPVIFYIYTYIAYIFIRDTFAVRRSRQQVIRRKIISAKFSVLRICIYTQACVYIIDLSVYMTKLDTREIYTGPRSNDFVTLFSRGSLSQPGRSCISGPRAHIYLL